MTTRIKTLAAIANIAMISILLASCYTEDPGPLQQMEKEFDAADFDRLEMGDAFVIRVEQGNFFSIKARGDERNIDDLIVKKEGSTLVIRFDDNHNRNHQTFIDITMPAIREAGFSGASNAVVTGFMDGEEIRISLSGASVCQFDGEATNATISLSGASILSMTGTASDMSAVVSGASVLKAFGFPVDEANVNASGASHCKVTVTDNLIVTASGASTVLYRGNPTINSNVSGGSSVHQD